MDYRKDKRTEKQFAKDIKECTKTERILMNKYVDWLNKTKGDGKIIYNFVDNGVNNQGNLLRDKDVDARADFILVKNGARPKLIDVKFSRKPSNKFRIKTNHVKRYMRDDVAIIVFMNLDDPSFCIVTPATMKKWVENKKPIKFAGWGFKEVYEIDVSEVTWYQTQ